MFLAKGALQEDQIQFLTTINNEAKIRRSTKSLVLGKAKVMSYEGLKEARAKRAEKRLPKKPKVRANVVGSAKVLRQRQMKPPRTRRNVVGSATVLCQRQMHQSQRPR
jgi:hypothetical protein